MDLRADALLHTNARGFLRQNLFLYGLNLVNIINAYMRTCSLDLVALSIHLWLGFLCC